MPTRTNRWFVPTFGISKDGRLHITLTMGHHDSLCGQPEALLSGQFTGSMEEFHYDRVRCPQCLMLSNTRKPLLPAGMIR